MLFRDASLNDKLWFFRSSLSMIRSMYCHCWCERRTAKSAIGFAQRVAFGRGIHRFLESAGAPVATAYARTGM